MVYDPFEEKHKVFLMHGIGKDRLTNLHAQLYDGPHRADFNADTPFQPHMTVATNSVRAVVEGLNIDDLGPLPIAGTIGGLNVVELRDGKLFALEIVRFDNRSRMDCA